MKKTKALSILIALLLAITMLPSCFILELFNQPQSFDLTNIPDFSGKPYVTINDNVPTFTQDEITTNAYEFYSELDFLGRCGMVEACCGKDLMPAKNEDRESISSVTPSGWVQARYDFVDGSYLYNRCHLIGWQLTAENANEKNLIAGTRYLNIEGMLPFENMIADYIKETGNHVMYRVTPIYKQNNLLPSGVHMQGYSVEDNGAGISFNVYCYNSQPGVTIDYVTGRSCASGETLPLEPEVTDPTINTYGTFVLNTNSKKIHLPECSNAQSIAESNRQDYNGDIVELISLQGYSCCGLCLKNISIPEETK